MHDVFNMGCGFCAIVAETDEDAALALLREHHPAARRVGHAVEGSGEILRPRV
jgi:phosphoribosylaminoimidazole (AIR) synthetase